METYYVDGNFVPKSQAVIPVDDLAVLRGLGVFDLIRTFNGHPYFLKEHVERLVQSADQIGMTLPWSAEEIEHIATETYKRNTRIGEANIRIVITGGPSIDFMTYEEKPRLIVMIHPLKMLPSSWYTQGVKVITIKQERDLPDAKSISYISAALALKKARSCNAIEALYVNRNNEVLEGTTSNLFIFRSNVLITPQIDILKGITRQSVLMVAKELFEIEQRPISIEELKQADEIFITGTNKGVVPVVQVDQTRIGKGVPGENTQLVIQAIERHTDGFKNT